MDDLNLTISWFLVCASQAMLRFTMFRIDKVGFGSSFDTLLGAPSMARRSFASLLFLAAMSVGVAVGDPVSVVSVLPLSAYSSESGSLMSGSSILNYSYNGEHVLGSGSVTPIAASITETATQLSADLSSGPPNGNGDYSPFLDTGSIIELYVSGPTYLSESLSVNYTRSTSDRTPSVYSFTEFQDAAGNLIGSPCLRPTIAPPTLSGSWTCTTGATYVSGPETVYLGTALNVKEFVNSQTDQSSVQATANLGDLQVTDADGNVIETINLENLVSTPEPGSFLLVVTSLAALTFIRKRAIKIEGQI